jgi:hypothetical protein
LSQRRGGGCWMECTDWRQGIGLPIEGIRHESKCPGAIGLDLLGRMPPDLGNKEERMGTNY